MDDANLRLFAGPPADAVEELIDLTGPFLTADVVPTKGDDDGPVGSESDHRPILRLVKEIGPIKERFIISGLDGGQKAMNCKLYT